MAADRHERVRDSSAEHERSGVGLEYEDSTHFNVMETLDLPYMDNLNAHRVEEALIAHFGPAADPPRVPEPRNGGGPPGQLFNQRHEISPDRGDYCDHLLVGQYILTRNPRYRPFGPAHYTRDKPCPGITGPR